MVYMYNDKYKQEVIDLILQIQNIEYGLDLKVEDQLDILDINSNYKNSGGGFWIALNESNKVIGCIGLQIKNDKVAILKKFFVCREYRGKEYGVGISLYNNLLDFAKRKGVNKIILDTPLVAKRSHNFYKKVGFIKISKEDLPIKYDYTDRNSLLYLLKI